MATYKPLQSVVLTSSTTSITFSNIDQNYTDLIFVSSFLKPAAGSPRFRFNSDTSSLYSQTVLYGNGTSALSQRETGQTAYYLMDFFNPSTTNPNHVTIHLHNYSKTTTFKTILERSGAADIGTEASIGIYRSTNAITSITINADGGSGVFSAGTTFDLYGIKAGTPKAQGGELISTDGTYWYHTFNSSGIFTVQSSSLTVDYLVLGGGATGSGGGSSGSGGGGGGGGSSLVTSAPLTPRDYTVIVGAGTPNGPYGSVGNNSTFNSTIGGGGQVQANFSVASQGGTGTTQNGGAGGRGFNSGNAENGGAGYTSSISGSSVTRGGGGGGSTKSGTQGTGTNGGGNGVGSGTGGRGTANTGGGGGGSAQDNVGWGGGGGSGVVIVRYPV